MANIKQTIHVIEAFIGAGNKVDEKEFPDFIMRVHQTLALLEGENGTIPTPMSAAPLVQPTLPVQSETMDVKQEAIPSPAKTVEAAKTVIKPFVPIEKSITDDRVICLCCGKEMTFLKGHITSEHKLTEKQYREMFNLSNEHPLTAPSYSAKRRESAKENNLVEKMQAGRRKNKAAMLAGAANS
ncbi:MAG: MucR family transcriptional regulator [Magnetococcus sp. YQC-5]